MINVTGHLNMDQHAHVRKCTRTDEALHITLFFSLLHNSGMEQFKFTLLQ